MKKKILLFLFMFLMPLGVMADEIYRVDMDIEIARDGTANITEIWDVQADSGTEWYKQLYNIGNSEISNFRVSMDGVALQEKTWDVDETIDEKDGYYGINYVSDGLELCFGKSDYDKHTFTLNYTLSNFIFNTDDSQVLYWTLMPNVTVDNFNVRVSSYFQFLDTLDVWGYGYKGYAYVQNGIIEMSNEGILNGDYVVLLVKFPMNTFDTTNRADFKTFDEVLEQAEKGIYELEIENAFTIYVLIIIGIYVLGVSIFIIFGNMYGYINNKKIKKKEVPIFRDIPCNKDIYYANTLLKMNNMICNDTNIFGAIILKWVRNKKIKFINEVDGIFNKENSKIDLREDNIFDNDFELGLFNMMRAASKDGILEIKELEKWCRKNSTKFLKHFSNFMDKQIDILKDKGEVFPRKNIKECRSKFIMSDKIYEETVKLYGLKKYLKEFSSIDTKEVMDVKLWDEYLMFAYLFGIADRVAKQLKVIYPEVPEIQNVDCDMIIFIDTISKTGADVANLSGGDGASGGGGSMGGR